MKTTIHESVLKAAAIVGVTMMASVVGAADWPPALDMRNPTTLAVDGRTIERYVHGPRESWGYPAAANGEWAYHAAQETGPKEQNHNSFYLVRPKNEKQGMPLCVVLHSANRTAYDYLGYSCLNRSTPGGGDPTFVTRPPDDFYALYLNSTNSEWWGYSQTRQNADKHINVPPPAERRVLDSIEWIVTKYKIDRNRIYLTGVSMGGCGSLGIGMPNGDVFSAVRVIVPAGTGYASYRMGGFAPSPAADASQSQRDAWLQRASGVGLPDPPVLVDFSSQMDMWATTQPALVQAAQVGRLPLILSWGPFGHEAYRSVYEKYPICEGVLAYPWLEIRKDQAYPVFTHASSDQRCPWLNAPADYEDSGQLNAYFRWKAVHDTPEQFAMQLWIAHPEATKLAPPPLPQKATVDVTFRRLQQFKTKPGQRYVWRVSPQDGSPISGEATANSMNLLTIPRLTLSTVPTTLTLTSLP